MSVLNFKTANEALASIGQIDENYGFELESGTKMENGTILLIEEPLTALVVIGNEAYTTDQWTHPNLKRLDMSVDKNKTSPQAYRQYLSSARYVVTSRKTELKKLEIKRNIVREINLIRGNKAELSGTEGLLINGQPCWDLSINEDYKSDTWRSTPTGKLSVSLGNYGHKHRFPERKDGSHNYPAIAAELVQLHKKRMELENQYRQKQTNHEQSEKVWGAIGNKRFIWAVSATSDPEKLVMVERKLTFSGTQEEVLAFMAKINKALSE